MAKEWRFILRSELRGEVELIHEPENWRSRETKLVRDMKRYGIAREIASPFVFVKDGYAYVKDVFNRQGYNAQVWVDVFQYDPELRRYVSYFSGELIMKTCEIEDIKLSVQATPSGIERLLKDREGKDVLIDTTWSFDYNFIPVEIPDVIVKTHSRLIRRTLSAIWTESRTYDLGAGEFLQIGFDEFLIDELPGVIKERATIDTTEVFPILKVEEEGEYTFDVDFLIRVDSAVGDELQFYYKVNRNGTPVAVSTVFESITEGPTTYNIFTVTEDANLSLKKGDQLYFYALSGRAHEARILVGGASGRPTGKDADKFIITADTTIGDLFPQGALAFELCEKALKNMLGADVSLYSTALGRTDIGYATDSLAGMSWIGTGKGLAAKGGQIKTSFRKLFTDGLAPLYNLGIGIESASDGSPRAVIEGIDYFFTGKVGFTIEGVSQLRKRVADQQIYSEVLVGFTKYESDLPGSIEDPHTQSNYLIPGRYVQESLDLRSQLIASSWKIEEKRRDFAKQNTRQQNDQDLYIIQVKRGVGEGTYESLRDESYETVEGVENADTLYNLDLIPSRVLRRWGANISSCYYRQNDLLRFASSESESNLSTQLESEDFAIVERQDIGSVELRDPLWLPEVYEFSAKLTAVEDRQLIAKKYDIIRVIDDEGNKYYGYLLERGRTEKNEAQFTLLRANYNG
jgi:hypothetical protein